MLSEQVQKLLNAPPLPKVTQGVDTYPRVLGQRRHGESLQLVSFALPGLRRAHMVISESEWINGHHLAANRALMSQLARLHPPRIPDEADDDHFSELD